MKESLEDYTRVMRGRYARRTSKRKNKGLSLYKTDADNGSKAICPVSNDLRSPLPEPKHSVFPRASRDMNRACQVALICGALPLLVGILIFLMWFITRWNWLMMAGMFTLFGGVAVFFIGAIALVCFFWLAFRTPELPRRRLWLSTLGCAALLLSNFAVAGGITASVIAIETRYTVVVHNTSQLPLSGVRVFGGGCEADFGTIPPNGIIRRSFWIQHDGELEFRAVSGATTHSQTIDGYVTRNMGGHTTVNINPDAMISVSNKDA